MKRKKTPFEIIGHQVELAVVALLAIASAAFCWAIILPLGPVGSWEPMVADGSGGSGSSTSSFDPFFRISASSSSALTVTPLDLSVHGIREDLSSGRGSAIIGTPDGKERSIAAGEEIMPGVVLKMVESEFVTISRDGKEEKIFLQQD